MELLASSLWAITNLFPTSTDYDTTAQRRGFGRIHTQGVNLLQNHHLFNQLHVGLTEHLCELLGDSVTILFQESVHVVLNRV